MVHAGEYTNSGICLMIDTNSLVDNVLISKYLPRANKYFKDMYNYFQKLSQLAESAMVGETLNNFRSTHPQAVEEYKARINKFIARPDVDTFKPLVEPFVGSKSQETDRDVFAQLIVNNPRATHLIIQKIGEIARKNPEIHRLVREIGWDLFVKIGIRHLFMHG